MAEIERLVNQIEQTPNLDSLIFQVGPLLEKSTDLVGRAGLFIIPCSHYRRNCQNARSMAGIRPAHFTRTGICAGRLERRWFCAGRKPVSQPDRG